MKQPLWKIWLSYLTELHIESTESEYNPHLYVSLRNGRYQLSAAHAVYSYADLYTNFRKAFSDIQIQSQPVKEVLILGFGLGSIPYMLEQVFDCKFNYTAVELDEEVLYLANKYVLDELASPIEIITADALAYVAQSDQQYDLICMDVFLDDAVPEDFETQDFLQNLREMLTPQGILLYNRLAYSSSDRANATDFFQNRFLKTFPEGTYIDTKENWILLNRSFS